MESISNPIRLNQIPVLYIRGDHASVGFTIGRQFKSQIEDVLLNSDSFNQHVLPSYETVEGKWIFDKTLATCMKIFPNYVVELEGMAKGSNIPFYKLFLLHLELTVSSSSDEAKNGETGCSSILSNGKDLAIGHTEDTAPELLNNVFIVSAEIIGEDGKRLEKFSTLTYAGCLPGYTMGFNEHGLIHTINTLYPLKTCPGKTPRSFIARALLGATNLEQVLSILRNKGDGISDGFSVNLHFAKDIGTPLMYNIEVCPNPDPQVDETIIDIKTVNFGESYAHCNKYLRIQTQQFPKAVISSSHRHEAIGRHPKPETIEIIKKILSDQSDPAYAIFRFGEKEPDLAITVVAGIFDISKRQWRIYVEQPSLSSPIVVLPLYF